MDTNEPSERDVLLGVFFASHEIINQEMKKAESLEEYLAYAENKIATKITASGLLDHPGLRARFLEQVRVLSGAQEKEAGLEEGATVRVIEEFAATGKFTYNEDVFAAAELSPSKVQLERRIVSLRKELGELSRAGGDTSQILSKLEAAREELRNFKEPPSPGWTNPIERKHVVLVIAVLAFLAIFFGRSVGGVGPGEQKLAIAPPADDPMVPRTQADQYAVGFARASQSTTEEAAPETSTLLHPVFGAVLQGVRDMTATVLEQLAKGVRSTGETRAAAVGPIRAQVAVYNLRAMPLIVTRYSDNPWELTVNEQGQIPDDAPMNVGFFVAFAFEFLPLAIALLKFSAERRDWRWRAPLALVAGLFNLFTLVQLFLIFGLGWVKTGGALGVILNNPTIAMATWTVLNAMWPKMSFANTAITKTTGLMLSAAVYFSTWIPAFVRKVAELYGDPPASEQTPYAIQYERWRRR